MALIKLNFKLCQSTIPIKLIRLDMTNLFFGEHVKIESNFNKETMWKS